MSFKLKNWKMSLLFGALSLALLGSLTYAGAPGSPQITADQKSKVNGTIISRNGDLVKVKDKKSGQVVVVSLSDDTKVERKKGKVEFFRHEDMDVTAMVPGLTIEAEGVGNAKGQLVAKKITFVPDEFAVEVAEEQQIMANKAAAGAAQTTANLHCVLAKILEHHFLHFVTILQIRNVKSAAAIPGKCTTHRNFRVAVQRYGVVARVNILEAKLIDGARA